MIKQLITQPQRAARKALEDVIRLSRDECAAFGPDLPWARYAWDVTKSCPRPANKSHVKSVLYFTTHDNGSSKGLDGRTPLQEPFCSLIKALVRLKQDGRPQTMAPLALVINAARDLELELRDRDGDPCLLLNEDFDIAARRVVCRSGSDARRYRLGQALEKIAIFIDEHGITPVRLDWRSPIRKVSNNRDRTSPHAQVARETMLPDADVLDGLGHIWNVVETTSDVVLMGAVTLLHCAPWRIVEELGLAADCERTEQKEDERGVVLDAAGRPVDRFGIAYWREKSGEPDIKWIPTVMVDTAKRALQRIREATAPARTLALWLHSHPGRAWLPGVDCGPDQIFTSAQVAEMFGLKGSSSGLEWLRSRGADLIDEEYLHRLPHGGIVRKVRKVVRRDQLEAVLLREMPTIPPGPHELAWHQRLFVCFANEHHPGRGTNPCLLELVTDQQIRDFLGGRQASGVRSGFDRLLNRPDLSARSHQMRHWLNTLAQQGGLEQALVARWSGREDIKQNGEYDHLEPVALAESARDMLANGMMMGVVADVYDSLPPVERTAFREMILETAHVTDVGFCLQNWNTSPCEELGACEGCQSAAVRKGDADAQARAVKALNDNQWVAERLRGEMDEETLGASQHHDAVMQRIANYKRIIAIHDDPSILDGTLVQPNVTSPIQHGGSRIRSPA